MVEIFSDVCEAGECSEGLIQAGFDILFSSNNLQKQTLFEIAMTGKKIRTEKFEKSIGKSGAIKIKKNFF